MRDSYVKCELFVQLHEGVLAGKTNPNPDYSVLLQPQLDQWLHDDTPQLQDAEDPGPLCEGQGSHKLVLVVLRALYSNAESTSSTLYHAENIYLESYDEPTQALAASHRRARRLTFQENQALAASYETGATINELAELFGISRTTAMAALKRQGVTPRYRKVTPELVAEAARLYETGLSLATIGSIFELADSTIHRAFRRVGVEIRANH